MKAEERLAALTEEASRYWEPPVEEVLDLAREAIALLRRAAEREMVHACPGPMTKPCRCGLAEFEADLRKFLDSEEGEK